MVTVYEPQVNRLTVVASESLRTMRKKTCAEQIGKGHCRRLQVWPPYPPFAFAARLTSPSRVPEQPSHWRAGRARRQLWQALERPRGYLDAQGDITARFPAGRSVLSVAVPVATKRWKTRSSTSCRSFMFAGRIPRIARTRQR